MMSTQRRGQKWTRKCNAEKENNLKVSAFPIQPSILVLNNFKIIFYMLTSLLLQIHNYFPEFVFNYCPCAHRDTTGKP